MACESRRYVAFPRCHAQQFIKQREFNVDAMPLQRSRGDETAIELFIAGIQEWEAGIRRRVDDGKSKQD